MTAYVIFFFAAIFILGAVMGSFVGAMTWRMHQHMDWVQGRSECEHCHHQLGVGDLIPIVSYLTLRGRCRYCRKPIGRTAIMLEIGTGLAFAISALLYPSMLARSWVNPATILTNDNPWSALGLGLWLICLTVMVALFVYDWRWHLLPNKLVLPLVLVSLACSAALNLGVWQTNWANWLISLGLGMLPVTGVYGLLYLVSHGRWIGLGDVKLGVAIGCLVPWWGGIVVLFLSNLLCTMASVPGLVSHRINGNSQIPFGPYLIASTYLVFLLGWLLQSIMLVL